MPHPTWELKHPRMTIAGLGAIPFFLLTEDARPAKEQLDEAYAFAGGWRPFKGFTMYGNCLKYSGDPPMALLAECKLRDETIRFYDCSWVAIVQPDGTYEISRMD